ncbi:MAG: isoprenylcysteine carboxylmethyltransferase family protein [Dehalococcoidales bacterium]|nr:isoprenylcysteine carboxylmethyltransferase family protein [Dehalococcoidales bacterium]
MTHRDKWGHLAGEHRLTDLGQAVICVLFLAVWIPDILLDYSNFLNQYIPMAVKIPIAVILILISGYMARTGMSIVFGNNANVTGVIRKGVFKIVRHPIYLSELILYVGLLLINLSLAGVGVWIIGIYFLHYVSRHEERLLLKAYGRDYEQYMKEVGMWFPRIFRK